MTHLGALRPVVILTSRCTNICGEEASACSSQHCTLGCQHVPHVQLEPPHTCPAWAHVSCMGCCPRAAAGDALQSHSQPPASKGPWRFSVGKPSPACIAAGL